MNSGESYSYSLHIGVTPDRVYEALTSADAWSQWFPEWRPRSVWQPGAPIHFHTADGELYSTGQILEAVSPRLLVYTWPEPLGEHAPDLPERLTWRLESSGPATTRLELVHDQLTAATFQAVTGGWPFILSNLKTVLETGHPLQFFPK
jgi:uncharacterized protein YndB with AHSA1/START domain